MEQSHVIDTTNHTLKTPDIDVLLNRAALTLSRSQRLAEAWIPLTPAEKAARVTSDTSTKNVAQLSNVGAKRQLGIEEGVLRPERAGLGAALAFPNHVNSATNGANGTINELEKLRKQLLGKGKASGSNTKKSAGGKVADVRYKHVSRDGAHKFRPYDDDLSDDDGDEGRARVFKSKHLNRGGSSSEPHMSAHIADMKKINVVTSNGSEEHAYENSLPIELMSRAQKQEADPSGPTLLSTPQHLPPSTTFLDEILANRRTSRSNKNKGKKTDNLALDQEKRIGRGLENVSQVFHPDQTSKAQGHNVSEIATSTTVKEITSTSDARQEPTGRALATQQLSERANKRRRKQHREGRATGKEEEEVTSRRNFQSE